jgi:hypothetical protein
MKFFVKLNLSSDTPEDSRGRVVYRGLPRGVRHHCVKQRIVR